MPFVPDQKKSSFVPDKPESGQGMNQNGHNNSNQDFAGAPTEKPLGGAHTKSIWEKAEDYKNTHQITPANDLDDPGTSVLGLVAPSNPMAGVGSLLRKGGDVLMQKAMGMSKVIPGLGEDFAKAGFWGTKSGMAGQAAQGMEKAGQSIGNLAEKIPGQISQDTVANKVAEVANGKMTPSGFVRPEDNPVVNRILSKAQDFATSEPITGAEMAARRAQAGKVAQEAGAYRMTNPSQAIKAQQAGAEQAGYSQALKDAYGKAFPGSTNALADADKSYGTYATASRSLNAPESMGTATNFLSQFIPTTLMESTAGRAAIGTGKAIQRVPRTAPISLYDLLGKKDSGQ